MNINIDTSFLGKTNTGKFIYEYSIEELKIRRMFNKKISCEEATSRFLQTIPSFLSKMHEEFKNIQGSDPDLLQFFLEHRLDPQSRKIEAFIISQLTADDVKSESSHQFEKKEIDQQQFTHLLAQMECRDPNQRISLSDLLTQNGYSPTLSRINFAIHPLTVQKQKGLGTTPAWGTDLLKNLDFTGMTFHDCNFRFANLSGSCFVHCSFRGCSFVKSVLHNCIMTSSSFDGCSFHDTLFDGSEIVQTEFKDCNLNYANFYHTELFSSTFIGELTYKPLSGGAEIFLGEKGLAISSYSTTMVGTNFLGASVKDCAIRSCDTSQTLFFETELSFALKECPSFGERKPTIALLWNNEQPGYSASKLNFSLKNDLVPLKFHFYLPKINPEQLNQEVEGMLKELKENPDLSSRPLSIPQALIQLAKTKDPQDIPNLHSILAHAKELLLHVEGLVFPGGADIEPEFFGQTRNAEIHQCEKNYQRTMLEFALLAGAELNGLPTMGICRGAQLVNVFYGGTLHATPGHLGKFQNLPISQDEEGGMIKSILGNKVRVLSIHRHAIALLAPGLTEIIKYEGVPKALEGEAGAPLILTQFHPEFAGLSGRQANYRLSSTNKNFWKLLSVASKSYRQKKKAAHFIVNRQRKEPLIKVREPQSLFQIKKTIDSTSLMLGKEEIQPSEYAWHLNLALLRHAYETADDPEVKERVLLSANNYLAKSAPLLLRTKTMLDPQDYDTFFNTTPYPRHLYHRQTGFSRQDLDKSVNAQLGFGDKSPLLLTDTAEIQDLFPTSFHLFQGDGKKEEWVDRIVQLLKSHVSHYLAHPLKKRLETDFLFDMTNLLSEVIITNGHPQKEIIFENKLDEVKVIMDDVVNQAGAQLLCVYPTINALKLKIFIKSHITTICRVELNGYAGIKILPIFRNLTVIKRHHRSFASFVTAVGLFMGAVNYRRRILNSFNLRDDIEYVPQGENIRYFSKKEDFGKLALLERLTYKFAELKEAQPHFSIIGEATIKLIHGLFNEIEEKQWEELNSNPATREVIQTTLVKLKENLAAAELHSNDFTKFTKEIELAHNELAVLLEFFRPFKEEDFSTIYKERLVNIPKGLQPFIRAGLGKTATNMFAGINAAIMQSHADPKRCYSPNLYYEEVFFLGWKKTLAAAMKDPQVKAIDLYACQFNPNIEINSDTKSYASRNIEEDIENIFQKKPDTKQLTVAIDCTIDYLDSPQVEHLLAHFEKEIIEGKFNFIFFRSGQKFDMMGMDNYFGSPFYVVHNGEEKWQPFNRLFESPAHRTDSLSLQWFCLANRYIADLMDSYRGQIFKNSRELLKQVPKKLKPKKGRQSVWISTVEDEKMLVSFIDIKITGPNRWKKTREIEKKFFEICAAEGVAIHSKPSFGFFIPNINRITNTNVLNIRINPGLDPQSTSAIIKFMKAIEEMA